MVFVDKEFDLLKEIFIFQIDEMGEHVWQLFKPSEALEKHVTQSIRLEENLSILYL
jgi:hypothetical protein